MAIDVTQPKNETSGITALKNTLVPLGGVLQGFRGEESSTRRVPKMTLQRPAGVEGCHKTSHRNLQCTLGLDHKPPQDANLLFKSDEA